MNKKTMTINDLKKILEILDPDERTYYSSDGYPLVPYIEDCLKPLEKYWDIPQEDFIKKIGEACGLGSQADITINKIKEEIKKVKDVERKAISDAEQKERKEKQSAQETYKKSKKVQGDKTRKKILSRN